MLKFGTELEMVIYYKTEEDKRKFYTKIKKYGKITGDGSLEVHFDEIPIGYHYSTLELVCKPMRTRKEFEDMLNDIFLDVDVNNFTNKGLLVSFNSSTGTHIHFSNLSKKDKCTPELNFFKNDKSYEVMIKEVEDKVKTNCVRNNFFRHYAKRNPNYAANWSDERGFKSRYLAINLSNNHRHGTMEFRLFNLRGTTKDNVIPVFLEQFDSILPSIKKAYEVTKEDYLKELKQKEELAKQKILLYKKKLSEARKNLKRSDYDKAFNRLLRDEAKVYVSQNRDKTIQ